MAKLKVIAPANNPSNLRFIIVLLGHIEGILQVPILKNIPKKLLLKA